jgi:hypothetical protein
MMAHPILGRVVMPEYIVLLAHRPPIQVKDNGKPPPDKWLVDPIIALFN